MDNKDLLPKLQPEFREFIFNIKCNLCGFQQSVSVSDTNQEDAKKNAIQTLIIIHQCPVPGVRKTSDFSVL